MTLANIQKRKITKFFLACGIFSSLLYPLTDILAGNLYKGYSFKEQAVSELFAIGAPTSSLAIPLFTLCSMLLAAFSLGVWKTSDKKRSQQILAIMIFGNAINSLILWNFFPMHMRGVPPTFTDKMHTILAINPFILISIVLGVVIFKNWFRLYSIGTILLLLTTAIIAFSYVPLLIENQPTPWFGLSERISQYGHQLWHAILATILIREQRIK